MKTHRYHITAQREYQPVGELLHAAKCLRDHSATESEGSAWSGISAVVMLAFAVEAFCNTYGPQLFDDAWFTTGAKRGMDRDTVEEKLRAIARAAKLKVDFGKAPWKDLRELIRTRDLLAHAKPGTHRAEVVVRMTDEATAGVYGSSVVKMPWELMAERSRAAELAQRVEDALGSVLNGLGRNPWELDSMGSGSYVMCRVPHVKAPEAATKARAQQAAPKLDAKTAGTSPPTARAAASRR